MMLDFAIHLFVGMSVGCGNFNNPFLSATGVCCRCGFLAVLKQNNDCLLFLAHLFSILMINSLPLASINGCRKITKWTYDNLGCKNKVISVHAMKACGSWRYGSTHSATTLDGDD